MTFNDLIAPLSPAEFMQRYLGKDFLLTRVNGGAWRPLVTWPELSTTLSTLRVAGQRVRIVQRGKDVDSEEYVKHAGTRDGGTLRPGAVASLLSNGATLVLNAVDELVPAVRVLADSFERTFRISIGVNLYAGWRTTQGFDLHWDTHDTVIIQLIGRKHWAVYRPTREHPIKSDKTGTAAKPTEPPVWEGLLNEGDVLYMPRGWWHVAQPVNEASVHLTVGMSHPTGADLVKWLLDEMHEHVEVRMPMPHLLDRATRVAYISALRERLVHALHDDVLDAYMDDQDEKDCKRVPLDLPIAVEGSVLDVERTRMRLSGARRLKLSAGTSGFASFRVNDKPWECDARLAPALALLDPHEPRGLDELLAVTPSLLRPLLKALLVALTTSGAIVVESRPRAVAEVATHEQATREQSQRDEESQPAAMNAVSA